MRIPFPERVSYSHAFAFASAISCVQILQHTDPRFTAYCFCFILVSALGFNLGGGMFRGAGAFIGCNAINTLIMPITAKAFLGEPAHTNLLDPFRTVQVYLVGMVGMTAAALVARRFRPAKGYISDMIGDDKLRGAYYGCVIVSFGMGFLMTVVSYGNGSIGTFLGQINHFPALAIVLGTIYTIRASNGKHSVSWPLFAFMLQLASFSFFSYSKEGMLAPFFCWIIPVALMRYKLHPINIVSFVAGIWVLLTYMVPYAGVGRVFDYPGTASEKSFYLLTHMDMVREEYAMHQEEYARIKYYNHLQGLLDRLTVTPIDDALIDVTDRDGTYFGYEPIIEGFQNAIPHFIWGNKPAPYFGNTFAHEIGLLADEDLYTGVSFSPSADAFHEGGMTALLVVAPLVYVFCFYILDLVVGDVRRNPVGLIITMIVTRAASEGGFYNVPSLIEHPLYATIIASFAAVYVLPVLGGFFGKATPLSAAPGVQPHVVPST